MMTEEQRIERIERYLDSRLSDTERSAFETEMASDPDLQRDVELHRKAHVAIRYAHQKELKGRLQKLHEENNPKSRRRLLRQFVIAASVLVVVAFGSYLINRSDLVVDRGASMSAEELAIEFFAPATVNQMRGNAPEVNTFSARLAEADKLFSQGDYAKASDVYKQLSGESHPQSEKAEWNMMLAQLAGGNSNYEKVLEGIAEDTTHMFHERATALVSLLDED